MEYSENLERWRHLKYLSWRLAKHYLDLQSVAESRWTADVNLSHEIVPGLSLSTGYDTSRGAIDQQNPFAVASELDSRLRNFYVDLSRPTDVSRVSRGSLVKATLLVQPAFLRVWGHDLRNHTTDPYYVVAFSSIDRIPGIGRVFFGLVGSESNLIALPGEGLIGARTASDARGLYEMIHYTREEADAGEVNPSLLDKDVPDYENATPEQRLHAVAQAFHGFDICSAPRPMEVLFEIHHVARDVDLDDLRVQVLGDGRVALAAFGAPIWIREATDRNYLSVADVLDGAGAVDDRWEQFDVALRNLVKDVDYVPTITIRSEAEWFQFAQWVVAWAARIGPDLTVLYWTPKRHSLLGYSWGDVVQNPIQSGIEGWSVHDWGHIQYLFTSAGLVYEAWERDLMAIYPKPTRPEALSWDDDSVEEIVPMALRTLAKWLLPFSR